ncbi:MAG: methionine aminotransferase [Bacteroidetes bacterium 24-39-8]|jgi:methionine aminotransferase|nr:MAG: methionine aminotransferase [Sphingobacteriia bacterium 35-40-8]OYZ51822.1 MAG: methionine aminotransferase [Bacteroidetes bacterium 24-39-8]OZA68004.1 MAG: methionine aminotransferase [Sphingobacteriia bacterium 39-39-8]HQR92541.1 methionine aminotransferase [Sediminibacterium sp.]HQS53735.1 methionine aminotransferase [Sediminibacterium sp.]
MNDLIKASKLPNVGTTIFTVMSQLATEHGAVNLGQGFPDFPMDKELTGLVAKAMEADWNQYAPMAGLPLLRQKLAEKVQALYGTSIDPDTDITITPGGTYAIYTALTAVLQPGDEVIVFEPAYDSYIPNIETNGAVPIRISLSYPDYSIPWDEVREKISSRTRMIMINTPHNPTGAVLNATDLQELSSIVADTQILILSDEVYEHLIYDGLQHESILRYPNLLARSFVCFSFGKTYHCTGWKLGYCISAPALMKEFRKIHQFNVFSCDTPKQVGIAQYMNNPKAYLELGAQMQVKRDYFRELMKDTPFQCIPSHGSYFECYSYGHFSQASDKDLAIQLTKKYGIASIPLSAFYNDGTDHKVLRFCFAKQEATLEKAVEQLKKYRP